MRPEIDSIAFGESVMQGAQSLLPEGGVNVDANESIQGMGMIDLIRTTREQYGITDNVIIQIGTNGPVSQAQYDQLADLVADIPHVYFLTLKAPKEWIAPNNELIRALPVTHPNVSIIDWATLGQQIESELSATDGGIHLNTDTAVRYYTNMILAAIGKPTLPAS